MTNPNQQLLDYAVENIKEWHPHHTCLRSDRSAYPLFYTGQYDGWDLHDDQWRDGGNFAKLDGTLGKTTPQVITKDEWLAEIKRREEDKPVVLERDKEYDVKLTGEEIAFLWYCTSNTSASVGGVYGLHSKMVKLFSACDRTRNILSDETLIRSGNTDYKHLVEEFFKPQETEDERKLRELKEKYAELGETIKAMERK